MSKHQNGLCINIFCYPKLLGLLVNTYEYENFKKDASTVNCMLLPSLNCTRYSATVFYNVNQSIYLITEYFCL